MAHMRLSFSYYRQRASEYAEFFNYSKKKNQQILELTLKQKTKNKLCTLLSCFLFILQIKYGKFVYLVYSWIINQQFFIF